ncbi:MAG: SOS response-associated peptidase [Sphingobacteriales bacterium]|jgi:putative SOS response-associated peptidase YedK
MCFYNGIKISRADHIRLKDMEISLSEYDLSLLKPLQSGFDFGDWPVIRPTRDDNHAELMLMHWELIPHYLRTWSDVERFRNGGLNPKTGKKDPPKNTLNAIGEEMLQKPTYRHAALNRRCLILSSFFYEWRHFTPPATKKDKAYPYMISVKDAEYFFIAGIWQPWTDQETGETIEGFSLVTTKANALMEQVHNKKKRMPLILTEDLAAEWISHGLSEQRIQEITSFSFPSSQMDAYTIDKQFRVLEDPTAPFAYGELPELIKDH